VTGIPRLSLVVLLLCGGAIPAHAERLVSSDTFPSRYPTVEAVERMATMVSERCGGRLFIDVRDASKATEGQTVAELVAGRLAMARISLAALDDGIAEAEVLSLPYLFRSQAHLRAVLDGPIGLEILAKLEDRNLIGLAFYDMGARSFYSTEKPIRQAAHLRNKRVRVRHDDIVAWKTMTALGARPMPYVLSRAYDALKSDAVDTAENTLPAYESYRHYEVARFFSLTEHSMTPGVLVFSRIVWDRLSREDQAVLRVAARESVADLRRAWAAREAASRNLVALGGGQITTDVDRRSLADAMAPAYEIFAGNPPAQALIQRIRAADPMPSGR